MIIIQRPNSCIQPHTSSHTDCIDHWASEAWERTTYGGVDNYTISSMKVKSLMQRGIYALD